MKKTVSLALVLVLIAAIGVIAEDMKPEMSTNPKWFDMENCEFCKNLMENPKLMDNMTWEWHNISNGAMSIATVKPEYKEAYEKAMASMEALANDMQTGKRNPMEVKMCGQCQAYGMLVMGGAKAEYVRTGVADISLITSDDEAMVKKIQEYAEHNRTEMVKWHEEHMMEEAK